MEKPSRNYGIDALRIISMMMVVVLHINSKGGMLSAQPLTASYNVALFWEIVAIGAVDIYALISGYVGYDRQKKYESFVRLWVETVFYSLLMDALFVIFFDKNIMTLKQWVNAFTPVTSQTYWYLTAYVVVFMFMPVLNWVLRGMSKVMVAKVILIGLVLSWWDLVSQNDIFKLNGGYSAIWIVFLYFIGGAIKKYYSEEKHKILFKRYCGWIYLLTICGVFAVVLVLQKITFDMFGKVKGDRFFVGYTAPTIVFASVVLLLFFSSIEIKQKRIVTFIAPATFGVYLIHNHSLCAQYIMPYLFGRFLNSSFFETTIVFAVGTVLIFLFAVLIDKIRGFVFEKTGIYALCKWCDNMMIRFTNKIENLCFKLLAK